MSPLTAATHFRKAALKAGVTPRFARLVAEPSPSVAASPGYPKLVAALYATTVREADRREAAAGCTEALELVATGKGR
jgi:hypothetical protein